MICHAKVFTFVKICAIILVMKIFGKCLTTVLAAAGLFTLAGCARGSSSAKISTSANWNVRTSTAVEKNNFDFWQRNKEVATYSLSFKEGSNSSYRIEYDNLDSVTYTTSFYMQSFNWVSETIEEYRSEESETEPVYVYETELEISGAYQLKSNGEKLTFRDELITKCYFRPAGSNLQPVYSYQKVINTAPAALSTGNVSSSYVRVDEEFFTYYNKACTQATVKSKVYKSETDRTDFTEGEKKLGLSGNSGRSNFDNSQLRAAIRGFTMSGSGTRTFNVVTPQNGTVQSVSAGFSNPNELNATDDAQIIAALNSAPVDYIFFDGRLPDGSASETPRNYRYNSVSLSINESLKGTSPTLWYSAVENNDVNATRCVLLKMSTPLSFGLGTLTYTLKSLDVQTIG